MMDFYESILAKKLGGGGGGITPTGTITLSQNGTFDVYDYASATVDVSAEPTGTLSITQNGIYNVAQYASADVNVSGGGGDEYIQIIDRTVSGQYSNSSITTTGAYAFACCLNLETISLPNCTTVDKGAFTECSKLNNVSLPACTSVGQQAFYYCSSLGQIYLPECTALNNNAFISCTKLSTASFPKCSNIRTGAFSSCKKLESLYLMNTSVITISTNVFTSSPMGQSSWLGHYGSIYVPQSLLATYQSATNWTSLSARLVGV